VTGGTHGSLDGNSNAGFTDMFLVKYNSAGFKQWTRQLGTSLNDYGSGVAVDGSGNVYVTGETNNALDGNPWAGLSDLFLVKYDAAGTKQWTRQLGTLGTERGEGVATDGSGNVYVTGTTNGSLDGWSNAGGYDMFLVKYDAAGTKQWSTTRGSSGDDYGNGVTVNDDGYICVTGETSGSVVANSNAGGYDMFLVKYNSAGVWQWVRQLGTSVDDRGLGVAISDYGLVCVTGFTYGAMDGNTCAGCYDIFIVMYDTAGIKMWTRQLGTSGYDSGRGIVMDSNGKIYVSGSTNGALDGNTCAGGYDMFLTKYTTGGIKL
jgi:hypothetical protein